MMQITAEKKAMEILKRLKGLGAGFAVLSKKEKEILAKMPEGKNVLNKGVAGALARDITIAFSHNENFRKPPCAIVLLSHGGKIVGEMTDTGRKFYNGTRHVEEYVLPPVPFPELDGFFQDVCSASPGHEMDAFIRANITVEKNDATLLVGFNLR